MVPFVLHDVDEKVMHCLAHSLYTYVPLMDRQTIVNLDDEQLSELAQFIDFDFDILSVVDEAECLAKFKTFTTVGQYIDFTWECIRELPKDRLDPPKGGVMKSLGFA